MNKQASDDILVEEGLEITAVTGGRAPVQFPGKVVSIFPALAHRNYQLYFGAQSISLIGFWLHVVAIGWLTFDITGSPFWIGVVAGAGGLPFLFFSTFAGVLIDKVDKQRLAITTQSLEMLIAFLLGILTLTGHINLFLLVSLAFVSGTIGSIDLPTRHSFLIEMVGRKDLASATSMNVGVFNMARFVGPALGGALIALFGPGWSFIINGISFIPPVIALSKIRPVFKTKSAVDQHPLRSLWEGISYSASHNEILILLILAFIASIFIWPFQTLMPAIAETIYNAGPQGYGSLLAAAGAGSLTAAILTSALNQRVKKEIFIMIGLLTASISLICFSLVNNFWLAHLFLYFAGFGSVVLFSTLNTQIQLVSPNEMRGRIMALYLTAFVGMLPVGNTLAGIIAEHTDPLFTIRLGASIVLLIGSLLALKFWQKSS